MLIVVCVVSSIETNLFYLFMLESYHMINEQYVRVFFNSFLIVFHQHQLFSLHLTVSNYHRKFGPIFRIKISQANAVFIKDPEMMRSVFVYEGKYPKHPLPESWTYFNQKHKCKRGLFFM